MFYKDEIREKEIKDKLLDLYIENLKKSVIIINLIIPIIENFDSKVYNKRLDNLLTERFASGDNTKEFVYPKLKLDPYNFELNLKFNNRFVSNKYLPYCYDVIRIGYISSGFSSYTDIVNYWKEVANTNKLDTKEVKRNNIYCYIDSNYNLRIKSKAIVDNLKENEEKLINLINKLKEEKTKVQEYVNKLNEIKESLYNLQEVLPHQIKDFYDIKSYANWQ